MSYSSKAKTGAAAGTSAGKRNSHRGGTALHEKNQYDIANVTWGTLESRFEELSSLMNTPATGVNALKVRATNRQRIGSAIAALLDKAQDECRKLLLDGDADAAEKAGVLVLRLRERFYKPNHVELIPAYLHLSRTKQFLKCYGEAEDMLSLAQYIMLKHPDEVSVSMKADLHQAFGLLYATDNKLEAAIQQLSRATYYLSLLYGPRHVLTTYSYFDLGNVMSAKSSMESAMAMYDAVKEIWYDHLVAALDDVVARREEMLAQLKYSEDTPAQELRHACYATAHAFGSDNLADASKMLHGIRRIQQERFHDAHPSPVRAEFVLGLFLLWTDNEPQAQRHLAAARVASQHFYGPRHPVVQEIESWCTKFDLSYNSAKEDVAEDESIDDGAMDDYAMEDDDVVADEGSGGAQGYDDASVPVQETDKVQEEALPEAAGATPPEDPQDVDASAPPQAAQTADDDAPQEAEPDAPQEAASEAAPQEASA